MSKPRTFSRFSRIVLLTFLPLFTLVLGWNLGSQFEREMLEQRELALEELFESGSGQTLGDPEEEVDITVLWSVWRLLQAHYIDPSKMQTQPMVFGAVKGLVNSIGDPYTTFMTPQENTQFRDALDGHLQGIGAELALKEERIVIVAPLKGAPAEKAGLLPEDIIVKVDDVETFGKSLSEVVTKIRGKKGTQVKLEIAREGEEDPLTFVITRDDITVPSVETEIKQTATGSVAYVSVNQFGSDTMAEIVSGLRDVQKRSDLKGLILDLRFNGGGYLDGAVEMSSLFLKQGKVVTVERRDGEPQRHYVSGRPALPDMPLVILINEGTASAAEIVAGALQDHKRATIIGMKSFGKGTVQEVIDLPGGASLRVTAAQWLTPNGRNLGKEGVVPDVEIDRTREQIEAKYDPQLNRALEFLTEK